MRRIGARVDAAEHAQPARAGDRRQVAGPPGEDFPRQPGEGHGLDEIRIQSVRRGGFDRHPGQRRRRLSSSTGLCTPPPQTSTRAQPGAFARSASAIGARGEGVEVACTSAAASAVRARRWSSQSRVELVAAGALGRRQRQPGLGQQASRATGIACVRRQRERGVTVVALAAMTQDPGIHQAVAGPGVEAAHVARTPAAA